jgi:hypothetical protein
MTEHFQGGSAVPGGYYLNASRWAVAPVARDGDSLPPGPGRWRRVPMPLALALVPILGVTFLMFMPVAGFVVLGGWAVRKVRGLFARAAPSEAKAAPRPAGREQPPAPQG